MKLETKIGVLALHPTSTDHVYCNSDSEITIRNVPYHGSIHFYKWSDGIFRAGREYIEHDSNGRAIPKRLSTDLIAALTAELERIS
jgi:hypothetical protein